MFQQGVDDQGVGLGRAEVFRAAAPEGQVAGGGSGLVPGPQGRRHVIGRVAGLAAGDALDRADLGGGELVPPGGQGFEPVGGSALQWHRWPAAAASFWICT